MNIFEHMNRKTAYTGQELADLMGEPLKAVTYELNEQYYKGRISRQSARGYMFYFLTE